MRVLPVILASLYLLLMVCVPTLHQATHTHAQTEVYTCCSDVPTTDENQKPCSDDKPLQDEHACSICQLFLAQFEAPPSHTLVTTKGQLITQQFSEAVEYQTTLVRLYQARAPPAVSIEAT